MKRHRVEAFQFHESMGTETSIIPAWFNQAILDGVVYTKAGWTYVKSVMGPIRILNNDWFLREESGNIFSCSSEFFQSMYEKDE